jgi:hypothetical protein
VGLSVVARSPRESPEFSDLVPDHPVVIDSLDPQAVPDATSAIRGDRAGRAASPCNGGVPTPYRSSACGPAAPTRRSPLARVEITR